MNELSRISIDEDAFILLATGKTVRIYEDYSIVELSLGDLGLQQMREIIDMIIEEEKKHGE